MIMNGFLSLPPFLDVERDTSPMIKQQNQYDFIILIEVIGFIAKDVQTFLSFFTSLLKRNLEILSVLVPVYSLKTDVNSFDLT